MSRRYALFACVALGFVAAASPMADFRMEVRGYSRPTKLYWFRESDLPELEFEQCPEHSPQLDKAFAVDDVSGNGVLTQFTNASRVWCASWNPRLNRFVTDPAYVAPSTGWIDLD